MSLRKPLIPAPQHDLGAAPRAPVAAAAVSDPINEGVFAAIAQRQLELHWQPKVSLATGAPVGFEALLRWNHPAHGLIWPGEFIEHAERTGSIVDIGRWVLREAGDQAQLWARAGICPRIAVNVSSRQLQCADLAEDVLEALEPALNSGVGIDLEITETYPIHDSRTAINTLTRLRRAGMHVHLDDFGAGYSTLRRLRRLPVDVVKLDRSLIVAAEDDGETLSTLQNVVTITKRLGVQTVAEGIETPSQEAMVRAAGIDFGQGYLYSVPMATGAAGNWWLEHAPVTTARRPGPAASPPAGSSSPRRIKTPAL